MFKKKKYICLLLIILFSLFFYNTCGIEDNVLFIQEPKNLTYDEYNFNFYFDGFNQEKDNGTSMFIGYDVYYFFDDVKNAKLAQVRSPAGTFPHRTLIDFSGDPKYSQLKASDKNSLNLIYEWVTLPVSQAMIDSVLIQGNSKNVYMYLYNYPDQNNPTAIYSEPNPQIFSGNKVYFFELYPNYSQYQNQTWGELDQPPYNTNNLNPFVGFLDKDYYIKTGIVPNQPDAGGYSYYTMYVYVVAVGFNSSKQMTRQDKIIESLKSNIIKINLHVKTTTNNNP
jgi:hypothetical protein